MESQRVIVECGDFQAVFHCDGPLADLIVTSPPYNLGKDYSDGDDIEYDRYLGQVYEWAISMMGLVKRNGRACINVPLDSGRNGNAPVYSDVVSEFRKAGWRYRTTIVWNEGNISRRTAWGSWCSSNAPNVISPVEMIPVFYLGEWNLGQPGATDLTPDEFKEWTLGHWTFPGESARRIGHPSPFPEELPHRLIKLFSRPGAMILDPFAGSGTTGVAAIKLGREVMMAEREREYYDLMMRRIGGVVDGISVAAPSA